MDSSRQSTKRISHSFPWNTVKRFNWTTRPSGFSLKPFACFSFTSILYDVTMIICHSLPIFQIRKVSEQCVCLETTETICSKTLKLESELNRLSGLRKGTSTILDGIHNFKHKSNLACEYRDRVQNTEGPLMTHSTIKRTAVIFWGRKHCVV